MKYMETVREIARGDGQWLKYDQKFRKSKYQLRVSWDNMHQELWLKAMHKTPDLTQEIINGTVQQNVHVGGQNFSNVQRIPNGYCVRYHVDIHTNAMFVINYIQQANVGMVVVVKIILI